MTFVGARLAGDKGFANHSKSLAGQAPTKKTSIEFDIHSGLMGLSLRKTA
jgi:hypothetical protein